MIKKREATIAIDSREDVPLVDHDPDCRACRANAQAVQPYLVWRSDLWVLRHAAPPYPALGWMTLHSRRHAPALTLLSETELADLGLTLARIARAIMDTTGALRVYLASMTEDPPHFHAHLVPRYLEGPKGWEVFQLKDKSMVSPPDITDAAVEGVIKDVAPRLLEPKSVGPVV